ncbi:chymotrypsin-elastase inhibitor ixodidin-like [Mixophyes fleayi]|uniref:chymotrypsin-elastase inhibitor ixodidin-like n=1 Tax=Mixophyes fleayi TaxID=3061075 RepID=UPI003F4D918D
MMGVSKILLIGTLVLLSLCMYGEAKPPHEESCEYGHQVYRSCGTDCPENCENFGQPIACTLQCVRGCFCQDPYIFQQGKSGPCVLRGHCPRRYNEY